MKVAHLIDSLKTGGAQKLLVTFSRQAIAQAGAQSVSVCVISLRADSDTPMAGELMKADARVVTLPGKGLFDLGRLIRLARFLHQEHFDVVQAHLSYSNILAGVAGRIVGVPVVCTLHNAAWDPRYTHPVRQWLEYWVLRTLARRVVAVGSVVASAHQARLSGIKLTVIANTASQPVSLSATERTTLRQELSGGLSGPLLISVGRLSPHKGYSDMLKAFTLVSARHPQTRLVIAGDGVLRDELSTQIHKLGIQESVSLLGARQDVPRLLAACDLYVSGSHFEGLPVAVLEAMNAGLPIIATQVGELPRVVVPGTGVLVPPEQPEQMAQAIIALLEDTNRREAYSQAARLHAEANFSPSKWFEKYLVLYQEILQGN